VSPVLGFIWKTELSAGAICDLLCDGSHGRGCRHEALVYSSTDEFVAGALPFLQQGLTRGDHALVVLRESGRTVLRQALGGDAAQIEFADAIAWYQSPEHAFQRYGHYISEHLERGVPRVRVVAEVIWPQSSASSEIAGWKRYEARISVEMAAVPASFICAYDIQELPAGIVADARRTHPVLRTAEGARPSGQYSQPGAFIRGLERDVPELVRRRD